MGRGYLRGAAVHDEQLRWIGALFRLVRGFLADHFLGEGGVFQLLVRHRALVLVVMLEAAAGHLGDGADVVRVAVASRLLNAVAPVVGLARQPVLKNDEGGHHVRALDVGDIRTFDAQRCGIQAQGFLQLLQRRGARCEISHALELVLAQLLIGVALDGFHQRPLVTALRNAQVHLCPAQLLQHHLHLIGFFRLGLHQDLARDGIAPM